MADKIKLHIGCGKRDFGKGWIHIDSQKLPHITHHNIAKLPFKDATVSVIYASHLVAYFEPKELIQILKEWNRVLKIGGTLRISTPDWDIIRKFDSPLLGPIYGKMGEPAIYHKTIYTRSSLIDVLLAAGFHKFRIYDHTQTEHAHIDDHSAAYYNGNLISLNIECHA